MRTLFLAVLMLPFFVFAEGEDSTKLYERKAIYSVSGAFTDLNNWNAGGENSSNISLLLRENWIHKGPSFTTVHLLEGNYGLSRQADVLTKNADKLEFTTTLTGSPKTTEWNFSGQFNVRTQFAPGYAKGDTSGIPISSFGAPIYGQFSLGLGNNSFDHWQVFISPVAGKSTTVLDQVLRDKGAFGVDTSATWRLEAGAKITLNYSQQFTDTFSITAKSDIFYNYSEPWSATDFSLDVIALYKIKEAFSVNAQLQLLRDIDQIDAWQRRSVLGLGLAYTIK
jgi:hypothetical protein